MWDSFADRRSHRSGDFYRLHAPRLAFGSRFYQLAGQPRAINIADLLYILRRNRLVFKAYVSGCRVVCILILAATA